MSVEPSVASFAMGRMVQASDAECHRSHNGIIPILGLTHPGICSRVTVANATLPHQRVYFLMEKAPVKPHKRSDPLFKKLHLLEYQFLKSLILGYS